MSRDTNFYYSFLVLPPRKRRAIVAVWDFCRAVDDAVDEVEPGPDAEMRAATQLEAWRVELETCYAAAGVDRDGHVLEREPVRARVGKGKALGGEDPERTADRRPRCRSGDRPRPRRGGRRSATPLCFSGHE